MSIWDGTIHIAEPRVGGIVTLAGNLGLPNGVVMGTNDRIYLSAYKELGWTDVGNGVALAPGETTLTVAVTDGPDTHFASLSLLGPDDWGDPVFDNTTPGFYSAIEYDLRGNLYTIDYSAMRFGPGHNGAERDRLYVSNRYVVQ